MKEIVLIEEEKQEEKRKVVEEPKVSLKQIAVYPTATPRAKEKIIFNSKYPSRFIPRYYEKARNTICNFFSANYTDFQLYFDEFSREAKRLRKEALEVETGINNRLYSSNALEDMVRIPHIITPILDTYVMNSNLSNTKDSIMIQGVKIGSMADLLLYENGGATLVGFIKFSFTKKELKKSEAEKMLYIIKHFFDTKKQVKLDANKCLLIEVSSGKVYRANTKEQEIENLLDTCCKEINDKWDSI